LVVKIPKKESPFQKSKGLQESYARALRSVAREVGKLVKGHAPTDQISATKLRDALRRYSDLIAPWAKRIVTNILKSVNNQDLYAWRKHTMEMGEATRKEILSFNTGKSFQKLMEENVELIKSIPLEAAERVHELVIKGLSEGMRADELAEKILKTESVTKSRATTIARTEIARAASLFTQARAENIGSTGYIWRTSKDKLVRGAHAKMEGKFVRWDKPPKLSDGTITHAGQIYNCRCYTEPEIPEYEE